MNSNNSILTTRSYQTPTTKTKMAPNYRKSLKIVGFSFEVIVVLINLSSVLAIPLVSDYDYNQGFGSGNLKRAEEILDRMPIIDG